jgi:hypothetical protein
LPILRQNSGHLPLTLEYKTADGEVAKIRAGSKFGLGFNPELAERLKAETGCMLRWMY